MHLDPGESRRIKAASHTLDLLPANAPTSAVLDAIRPCVPFAAGLVSVISPGEDGALVSQPLRLPPEVFESWLRMPPNLLQMTLAPVLLSGPGTLFCDSETLCGAQREQLEILRELDGAGLGEGAGYKLLERPSPWYGVEHLMLALLMERGERVPARSQVMLSALHEHLRAAILRLSIPLLSHQPIYPQIVAEQSLGYICLSQNGLVLEANRRAREFVDRYGAEAGIQGRRRAVEDFAVRALKETVGGQPWQLRIDGSPLLLQVDATRLPKETHVLPEDTILLSMREVHEPQVAARALRAIERLTKRERQIALLLAQPRKNPKEIAFQLGITPNTLRKHAENIYKKLGVQSRLELAALLNNK
jgi:DNA-binding CsgD family transcriptional regulator